MSDNNLAVDSHPCAKLIKFPGPIGNIKSHFLHRARDSGSTNYDLYWPLNDVSALSLHIDSLRTCKVLNCWAWVTHPRLPYTIYSTQLPLFSFMNCLTWLGYWGDIREVFVGIDLSERDYASTIHTIYAFTSAFLLVKTTVWWHFINQLFWCWFLTWSNNCVI